MDDGFTGGSIMDHVVKTKTGGADDDYAEEVTGGYDDCDDGGSSGGGWAHTLIIAILVVLVLLVAYHIYCSMSKKSICNKQMAYARHFFGMA